MDIKICYENFEKISKYLITIGYSFTLKLLSIKFRPSMLNTYK